MNQEQRATSGRLRFTIKSVLISTAFIAVLLGWYRSTQQYQAALAMWQHRCANTTSQLRLASIRKYVEQHATVTQRSKPEVLHSVAQLEGVNLRDITIRGDSRAFRRAIFDNSDLTYASLGGDRTSFQCASFNNAILRYASLGGGSSSFQLATFENADLSEAILVGGFQGISLKHAICVGTTIEGNIQSANIDAARFQEADLSGTIDIHLQSAYFDEPPEYDANTKFPEGFDPVAMGWKKTPASPKTTD